MASEGRRRILRFVISPGRKPVAQPDYDEEEQGPNTRLSASTILKTAKGLMNDGSYMAQKLVKSTGEALTRLSKSTTLKTAERSVRDVSYVTKRVMKITGKASWIFWTTFLILIVPVLIEVDREQQVIEHEAQVEQANY
ncbi:hypothetical protein ACLB2K_040779 [Fragaria x ananassa]